MKGPVLTLSVNKNQLKCCSFGSGIIKVYSLSGELLQTHGTRGGGDAGQLNCPLISDDDDDGSVLIADCGNVRIQVMSKQMTNKYSTSTRAETANVKRDVAVRMCILYCEIVTRGILRHSKAFIL